MRRRRILLLVLPAALMLLTPAAVARPPEPASAAATARRAGPVGRAPEFRGPSPQSVYDDYRYAGAYADSPAGTQGAYVTATVARPAVSGAANSHSLFSMAATSAAGTIEVGWSVDRLDHDGEPHLFVFHYTSTKSGCYNGCGFVPARPAGEPGAPPPAAVGDSSITPPIFSKPAAPTRPGDRLSVSTTGVSFAIRHWGKAWWIWYDRQWVGYFPDSLWKGAFTGLIYVQWFGEVADGSHHFCADMGNGLPGTDARAARAGEMRFLMGSNWVAPAAVRAYAPTPALYSLGTLSPAGFRYGGLGRC
jgi:hypothetical protein